MTFDDLRAARPADGFALYAIEPGGPVTFEVYADGRIYTWTGPTADEVLTAAFPAEHAKSVAPWNQGLDVVLTDKPKPSAFD